MAYGAPWSPSSSNHLLGTVIAGLETGHEGERCPFGLFHSPPYPTSHQWGDHRRHRCSVLVVSLAQTFENGTRHRFLALGVRVRGRCGRGRLERFDPADVGRLAHV